MSSAAKKSHLRLWQRLVREFEALGSAMQATDTEILAEHVKRLEVRIRQLETAAPKPGNAIHDNHAANPVRRS